MLPFLVRTRSGCEGGQDSIKAAAHYEGYSGLSISAIGDCSLVVYFLPICRAFCRFVVDVRGGKGMPLNDCLK